HPHPSGVTVEFVERRWMIGNLQNMSKSLVTVPDVSLFDIGDHRVCAIETSIVKRAGSQKGVNVCPSEWPGSFGRDAAVHIICASFDASGWRRGGIKYKR